MTEFEGIRMYFFKYWKTYKISFFELKLAQLLFESNNLNPDEVHLNWRFHLYNMYTVICLYEAFCICANSHSNFEFFH